MGLWQTLRESLFDPTRAQLRRAERQLRTHQTQAELKEAEQRLKRLELREAYAFDWVGPYVDLLNRNRQGWDALSPLTRRRQHGTNFPLYTNDQELSLLRAPSRILCSTNSYVIGINEGLASYIFGANGFNYSAQFKDDRNQQKYPGLCDGVQKIIDEFLKVNSWHGDEQCNLEEELFFRSVEDGEFIIVSFPDKKTGMTMLRVIEPEYMLQKPGGTFEVWSFGVKVDPEDCATPLAYYIQHGGLPEDGQEYSVDRVTHFRRRAKRNQKRGLPEYCFGSLEAMESAMSLLLNGGDAAAQQASIVGVRQHDNASKAEVQAFVDEQSDFKEIADGPTGRQQPVARYGRGRWEDIAKQLMYVPGPLANNADAHQLILQSLIRSVCTRWNAPEWLGSSDASNNNYSSALVAGSHFVLRIQREQARLRSVFVKLIQQAVDYALQVRGKVRCMTDEGNQVEYSADDVKRLVEVTAECSESSFVNPLEVAQVRQIERQAGVLSPQTWAVMSGYDPDEEQAKIQEWNDANGPEQPLDIASMLKGDNEPPQPPIV